MLEDHSKTFWRTKKLSDAVASCFYRNLAGSQKTVEDLTQTLLENRPFPPNSSPKRPKRNLDLQIDVIEACCTEKPFVSSVAIYVASDQKKYLRSNGVSLLYEHTYKIILVLLAIFFTSSCLAQIIQATLN